MNTQTYWNSNGKFQTEYDQLYNKLVKPFELDKDYHNYTNEAKLLAYVGRLYYDCFNNGSGNMVEYVEETIGRKNRRIWKLDDDAKKYLNFIHKHIPESKELLNQVAHLICISRRTENRYLKKEYFDECFLVYDQLVDLVVQSLIQKVSL